MRRCPMCGMSQTQTGVTACQFCDFVEKPMSELSAEVFDELMAPYDYEKTEDGGCRINAVKNPRSFRGYVVVPHIVTEIGPNAYACCKFLARIELPKGLRSIGDGAFAACRDLFDVFIPESVTRIGKGVFADCYDLSVVSCAAPEKPEGWDDAWLEGCDASPEWSSVEE